jgi:hypothetical protein
MAEIKESTLKSFVVSIARVSYCNHDFHVEAENEEDAARIARQQEGDVDYSEASAEYFVNGVRESAGINR